MIKQLTFVGFLTFLANPKPLYSLPAQLPETCPKELGGNLLSKRNREREFEKKKKEKERKKKKKQDTQQWAQP
jgi:hypothetical protein